jgi:Sel1 repeat
MAAEASSGTNQQLTLDHSSFEKLLAAAWVLQCLHDQLHVNEMGRDEATVQPPKIHEPVSVASLSLPLALNTTLLTKTPAKAERFNNRTEENRPLARLVEVQPSVEGGSQSVTPVAKVELRTIKVEKSHSDPVAKKDIGKPAFPPLKTRVDHRNVERAQQWAAFKLRIGGFRNIFVQAISAFANRRMTFRVHLPLRALRTVVIATPVLLLAMILSLLLVETWRHESFHSAEATSRTVAPNDEAAIGDSLTTAQPQGISDNSQRFDNQLPSPAFPSPEASHKRVTDPDTLSVVQQLSRYEIRGLRRRAKYGDDAAAFTLGMAYEVGRFVRQNCAEATHWVTAAAEDGNSAAQYNLGLRYRDGDGVSADRAESEKWLRKAASHRYRNAKLALQLLASR